MRICVGICTWNRARLLEKTLQQMTHLRIPKNCDLVVLVVNNNCSDDTDEVIFRFEDRLPLCRLFEGCPGKSHALNSAVQEIDSDWILWTDDDVLVEPDWIEGHLRAVREFPDADFFAGQIEPDFEIEPPSWIVDYFKHLETAYAVLRFGDEPIPLDAQKLPFGANFAIKTELQKQYLYDISLGRVGPSEVRGEETALAMRLLEDGYQGFWNPYSKVHHFIPRERLTKEFLQRFFYGIGQTMVLMNTEKKYSLTRRMRYLASAASSELTYQLHRRVTPESGWVRPMIRASYRWGRVDAANHSVQRARAA